MISIILASGQGSRLVPLSYYIPKVLLPVRGKPVLDYILSNLKNLDIDTHYVVISEHKEAVEKYLRSTGLDNVSTVRGLEWESGGDLAIALEQIDPASDVAVMNGDIVTDVDMAQVYAEHLSAGGYVTMAVTKINSKEAKRFGRVTFNGKGKVTTFREKTKSGSNYVNMGFYIFDRKLVKERKTYLMPRKFKYEPVLLSRLAREGRLAVSMQTPKYFWDVGTMDSYLEAEDVLKSKGPG